MNNTDKNEQIFKVKDKKRNPGVDIIRIIAMYCIVMNHILFYTNAYDKFYKNKKQLMNLNIFTDWHNDGFILISGIVGYKTNRYSNLIYLWLTVLFYSLGIHLYYRIVKKKFIETNSFSADFFPIIFRKYWYFTAYFGMYLFLPVINKGISILSKYEHKLVVVTTLGFFVIWKDFKNTKNDVFNMISGYSMIWLMTFYLTGSYIGKYQVIYSGTKKYISCFIYIFIYIFVSYLYIKIKIEKINNEKLTHLITFLKKILSWRYDSFIKITQSITACLFFLQLSYNKYLDKIICFLGPHVFGIYLIHNNKLMKENLLQHIFSTTPINSSLTSIIILLLFKSIQIFILSIIIDYLRNLLFIRLRLRKICVFIEKFLIKVFS